MEGQTSMTESKVYIFRSGPVTALTGTALVTGLILLVSTVVGHEKGVPSATIMFALSVGIVSSGVMDKLSKRRGRHVGTGALVLNAVLSSVTVYLLVSTLMGSIGS